MVDEVTIHNKALSTDEVKQNYDKILESQHIEETEFGGRWFDEFIDGTGIERNENISVDNGAAELDRGEFSIEGCVGYWNFDEGSGNTAHDTSGKGIDGTLMNMDNNDWVDGVNGTALEFDGGDDYIDLLEGDNILGISRDFSIGCYIRPDSVGTGSQAILDLNYQSTNDNRGNGILLFLAPDSKVSVCLYLADDADGKLYRIKGNSVLQSSEIYHVAVTRNMNDMRIYLNGVEDGNGVVSAATYSSHIMSMVMWEISIPSVHSANNKVHNIIDTTGSWMNSPFTTVR